MNLTKIASGICVCFISMMSYAGTTDHGHGKDKKHHNECCKHEHHGKSEKKKHHGHDCDDKHHGKHDKHKDCCCCEKQDNSGTPGQRPQKPETDGPNQDDSGGVTVIIGGKEYKVDLPGPFKIPTPPLP